MKLWLMFFLLSLPMASWADGNNYGAASYLGQGAGARALGMGGAFVAVADDATAGYWNPAGLSQMELYSYQAAFQYAFLANNFGASFLSYAFLWPGVGNFSLAWMNLSAGGIERRDENETMVGNFDSSENAFLISYGRKVYNWVKGLSLGGSLKILQQGLDGYSAAGHGLDLGLLWQPVMIWDHTLGLNVQNVFQRTYWSTGATESSLINAKLGAAFRFFRSDDELYFNHLMVTTDMEFSEYRRFNLRTGIEYWYLPSLGIRSGYTGQEITLGVSYRPEHYELDYSFLYDLTELGSHQHRVSLLLRFE